MSEIQLNADEVINELNYQWSKEVAELKKALSIAIVEARTWRSRALAAEDVEICDGCGAEGTSEED